MTQRVKEIKIGFLPSEIDSLTRQAADVGLSRSALIRQRATTPPRIKGVRQGPQVYAQCVEAAARTLPGVPRTQLEALVTKVINTLVD